MSWGPDTYGDPCRECGFSWSISFEEAVDLVIGAPERISVLVEGSDGTQRHRDLQWNVSGYVSHVVDNLRIWAERLASASLGATSDVVPYDQDLLSKARGYNELPLSGALWSLRRSVDAWTSAILQARDGGVILRHPDRGDQSADDVARTNSHDTFHHEWDISRSTDLPAVMSEHDDCDDDCYP
jgi:hypothetical protein